MQSSVHSADQLIDQFLSVAMITTLDKVPRLLSESATSIAQLKRPQKVVGLLEMRSASNDFVDQILHADDTVFSEGLLDDGVVR